MGGDAGFALELAVIHLKLRGRLFDAASGTLCHGHGLGFGATDLGLSFGGSLSTSRAARCNDSGGDDKSKSQVLDIHDHYEMKC